MKPGGPGTDVLSEFPSTMRRLLGNRKVIVASIAVFAHAFCHWDLVTFIPLLGAEMGMNELMIGLTLTANAVVIAVSLPIVVPLADRVGRFTPIAAGLLLSVAAFVFLPLAPHHWILPALNAVLGLCAVLVFSVSQAATMEALSPGERGSATGVLGDDDVSRRHRRHVHHERGIICCLHRVGILCLRRHHSRLFAGDRFHEGLHRLRHLSRVTGRSTGIKASLRPSPRKSRGQPRRRSQHQQTPWKPDHWLHQSQPYLQACSTVLRNLRLPAS